MAFNKSINNIFYDKDSDGNKNAYNLKKRIQNDLGNEAYILNSNLESCKNDLTNVRINHFTKKLKERNDKGQKVKFSVSSKEKFMFHNEVSQKYVSYEDTLQQNKEYQEAAGFNEELKVSFMFGFKTDIYNAKHNTEYIGFETRPFLFQKNIHSSYTLAKVEINEDASEEAKRQYDSLSSSDDIFVFEETNGNQKIKIVIFKTDMNPFEKITINDKTLEDVQINSHKYYEIIINLDKEMAKVLRTNSSSRIPAERYFEELIKIIKENPNREINVSKLVDDMNTAEAEANYRKFLESEEGQEHVKDSNRHYENFSKLLLSLIGETSNNKNIEQTPNNGNNNFSYTLEIDKEQVRSLLFVIEMSTLSNRTLLSSEQKRAFLDFFEAFVENKPPEEVLAILGMAFKDENLLGIAIDKDKDKIIINNVNFGNKLKELVGTVVSKGYRPFAHSTKAFSYDEKAKIKIENERLFAQIYRVFEKDGNHFEEETNALIGDFISSAQIDKKNPGLNYFSNDRNRQIQNRTETDVVNNSRLNTDRVKNAAAEGRRQIRTEIKMQNHERFPTLLGNLIQSQELSNIKIEDSTVKKCPVLQDISQRRELMVFYYKINMSSAFNIKEDERLKIVNRLESVKDVLNNVLNSSQNSQNKNLSQEDAQKLQEKIQSLTEAIEFLKNNEFKLSDKSFVGVNDGFSEISNEENSGIYKYSLDKIPCVSNAVLTCCAMSYIHESQKGDRPVALVLAEDECSDIRREENSYYKRMLAERNLEEGENNHHERNDGSSEVMERFHGVYDEDSFRKRINEYVISEKKGLSYKADNFNYNSMEDLRILPETDVSISSFKQFNDSINSVANGNRKYFYKRDALLVLHIFNSLGDTNKERINKFREFVKNDSHYDYPDEAVKNMEKLVKLCEVLANPHENKEILDKVEESQNEFLEDKEDKDANFLKKNTPGWIKNKGVVVYDIRDAMVKIAQDEGMSCAISKATIVDTMKALDFAFQKEFGLEAACRPVTVNIENGDDEYER